MQPRSKPYKPVASLMKRSSAAWALDAAIMDYEGGARILAADLGVHESEVCRWRSGSRTPAVHHREKLERLTGVPASLWPTRKPPTGEYVG